MEARHNKRAPGGNGKQRGEKNSETSGHGKDPLKQKGEALRGKERKTEGGRGNQQQKTIESFKIINAKVRMGQL